MVYIAHCVDFQLSTLFLRFYLLSSVPEVQTMPLNASGASAKGSFATRPHDKDPYQYQVGFGNLFASEAL